MVVFDVTKGTDALVLGSVAADEVPIREMEGQGMFVAEMRINLWQKRMRVSGRVSVEFIARGVLPPFNSSLTHSSLSTSNMVPHLLFPTSTTRTTVGMWQVVLCLLEHSPPTFIDSQLVIDPPPTSSNPANTEAIDLILLSPPSDDPGAVRSPPPTSSTLSHKSKSKSKALQIIQVHFKSTHRLAYRAGNAFLTALDAAFLSQREWSPSHTEHWSDDGGSTYTNAIVVPLDNGAGAELLYEYVFSLCLGACLV